MDWFFTVPVILAVPALFNFLQDKLSLDSSVSDSYTNSQYTIEKPMNCKVGKKYRKSNHILLSLHTTKSMSRSDRESRNTPFLSTASRFPLPKTAFIANDNHNIISPVPLLLVSFVPVSSVHRFRSLWIVIILPLSSRSRSQHIKKWNRHEVGIEVPLYPHILWLMHASAFLCHARQRHSTDLWLRRKIWSPWGRVYFLWYRPRERVCGSDWCAGGGKECRLEYLPTVRSCAGVVCNCELYGTSFVNLQTEMLDDYLLNMRNICLTTSQVTSGEVLAVASNRTSRPNTSEADVSLWRGSACLSLCCTYFFFFHMGKDIMWYDFWLVGKVDEMRSQTYMRSGG